MASKEAHEVIAALDGTPEWPQMFAVYVPHRGWQYHQYMCAEGLSPKVFCDLKNLRTHLTYWRNRIAKDAVPHQGGRASLYGDDVDTWRIANLMTHQTWSIEEFQQQFNAKKSKRARRQGGE